MASAAIHHNGYPEDAFEIRRNRFSDIPHSIDIPVSAGDDDDDDETAVVEVDPDALPEDPTELCTLLENERSPRQFWMYIALAYAKHEKIDISIEIMQRGLAARGANNDPKDKLPMLNCLTWLYLQRSREAPKSVQADQPGLVSEAKTKDYYLQLATQALNETARFGSSVLSTLARGTFSVFKASATNLNDRTNNLDSAAKLFDEAIRMAPGDNLIAVMGKARVLYARKRFDRALECYQDVLLKRPDMDPDPRIGIGLCFWQLGHKDDAHGAWERALEIAPDSKVAHVLLAFYHLNLTSTLSEYDPEFIRNYKLVIDHTQKAYKNDKNFPAACITFAGHFYSKKGLSQCELLARKAIEYGDGANIAGDAWYMLGRKFHAEGNLERALSAYQRSDSAREGGWLPARMGVGQVQVLMKDITAAKYTFEAIVQSHPKCMEAKTILGTLYADEVLSAIPRTGFAASKEDVTLLHKKAIALLEAVRISWKAAFEATKKTDPAHEALLLTLSRLYENDQPEKALVCLEAVQQIYADLKETDEEIMMPVQLLNNIAVFYWHTEKYDKARELYQRALNTIPELKSKDETADTDALATTLTYNLARCEEAVGNNEEAIRQYEQLLAYHDDYVDANMRLAYLALRRGHEDGPKRIQKLMQTDNQNLEVRALYAYYLGKQKRKGPINIAEDQEQRHFKHTLQHYDKHDRYSLTGMGNLYLLAAREMKRDTESDKEKRRKTYEKAVEFFDKALQLDPKNAYAAQGVAIAMVEDRKELKAAVGVFGVIRETLVRDASALINLGHCLSGLEQWGRAIENYETALHKYQHGKDPNTLTCLGRVWFAKGKKERPSEKGNSLESFKNALDYAKRALAIAPQNVIFMFNVAFVQFQLVQLILQLSETQRSLVDVESAAVGLDEAIQTFSDVARSKNPPYPPQDIEARSTMGRNTLRKQLERAIQSQREYEDKNAARLTEARRKRDEDLRRKQEAADAERKAEEERKKAIAEQRRKMQEEAREYAERKEAEERAREDELLDENGQKKRKHRGGKSGGRGGKRSKKDRESSIIESESESDTEPRGARNKSVASSNENQDKPPAKKRKKLTRAKRANSTTGGGKFKSSEVVNSSDDNDDDDIPQPKDANGTVPPSDQDTVPAKKTQRKKRVAADSDDDEEMPDPAADELFGEEKIPIDPQLTDTDAAMPDRAGQPE